MKGFIYIIKNTINKKVYIGQTRVSIDIRWKEHLRHAAYGDQVINRAMRKYGKEYFYIELLEECSIEELDNREIYYISLFNSTDKKNGYNVSIGGLTPRQETPVINIRQIKTMYEEQQLPIHKIAKLVNISRYHITAALRNYGVQIRDRHVSACKINKLNPKILNQALQECGSLRSAAKKLGLKYSTFRQACLVYNIEYNSPTSVRH